MIQEDYVSFEVAKLLKEKGFDEVCEKAYISSEAWSEANYEPPYINKSFNEYFEKNCCAKPTLQMAMKWLRKKYNLCIVSLPVVTDDNGEAGCLWNYMISKKLEISHNSENLYESHETALNDAIKYCLENLI